MKTKTFIGSPILPLDAARKGIFGLEATFTGSGGIIFGADDIRLKTFRRNVQNQSGENYISYYLDTSAAQLIIIRVGYAEGDTPDKPLATVQFPPALLQDTNTLTIKVFGNTAATLLNGQVIDGDVKPHFFFEKPQLTGRQLNPLGESDVITFPRLNKIGLMPGGVYGSLTIFNLRPPHGVLFNANKEECASLIGSLTDPTHGGTALLSRTFNIKGEIATATAHITARGTYCGTLNGQELNVGNKDYFTPGASHFDRHLFFHTYNVAPLLQQGENCLEFTITSGWWSDAQNFMLFKYNFWGDNPSLCMELIITYTSGHIEIISTDETWRCATNGPIRYASHFHGETYDARLENAEKNWQPCAIIEPTPIYEAGEYINAPDLNVTQPEMTPHLGNPVGEAVILRAQSLTTKLDCFIYDMGQNMVGVPRIKVKGEPGQQITLRYAEALYPPLPRYGNLQGCIFTENLRDADCTDIYICKGDSGGETIAPRFTFHGYRYIEISGLDTPPALHEVEGVVLSSILEETGHFECSSQMVNRLFENIRWSQRANFISIPTDCPQRNERMGWMGDAQVFAETATYNANVQDFFRRFLVSVRDLQRPNGCFPDIAPQDGAWGGIPWGSAGIIVPWTLYRQYGNREILEENYSAMQKYIEYLQQNSANFLLDPGIGGLGDWLAYDMTTDDELIWNAIFAYDTRIVADTAKVLGDTATFAKLDALYSSIKQTWNKTFVCPHTGKTRNRTGEINDTQTSYALPLYYGIFNNPSQAAAHLNRKTEELGYLLTTGFLGTQCIAAALSDNGYANTAYKLLQQEEYPSWLYPITQGATTIWERWNSQTHKDGFGEHNNMNSFNHYSLGAVGAWLYSRVLGIRPGEGGGYKNFIIAPCFGELAYAEGHYDTQHGRIHSRWEQKNDGYALTVGIPPGTSATILLPGQESVTAQAGEHEFFVAF